MTDIAYGPINSHIYIEVMDPMDMSYRYLSGTLTISHCLKCDYSLMIEEKRQKRKELDEGLVPLDLNAKRSLKCSLSMEMDNHGPLLGCYPTRKSVLRVCSCCDTIQYWC